MNRREAEELLPWFVAGTLDSAETDAVQAFIDSGEIPKSQLEELALFAESVGETGAEEPAYNPAILTRAMQQLDQVEQAQPDEPLVVREAQHHRTTPGGSSSGWFASLLDRLQWSLTPPLARIAIGAQFALLVGLVVALGAGESGVEGIVEGVDDGQGGYETVANLPPSAADLSVVFVPGTAETQIRKLLLDNQASIIAGPTALGVYTLDIADSFDLQVASDNLSTSSLTLLVQPAAQP